MSQASSKASEETTVKLIHQAYRFPLNPTKTQEGKLLQFTGSARLAYNWGLGLVKLRLNMRKSLGPQVPIPWSYNDFCSEWKVQKTLIAPWRDEVIIGSFQTGLEGISNALRNYSQGKKTGRQVGFPKFKARGKCKESVFSQKAGVVNTRYISFPKIGQIKTREKTNKLLKLLETDSKARILRGTISQSASGKWFISFMVERSPKQRQTRKPRACVGVDLGISSLAVDSTGKHTPNPRPLLRAERKLKSLQKQLERQRRANNPNNYLEDGRIKPGPKKWHESQNMKRTRLRTNKLHEKISNIRRTTAHQLTRGLVDEYGVIGVESLQVTNMLKNKHLSKHIGDASWGKILQQLKYKTEWSNNHLVSADKFYPSSKTCSQCQAVKSKPQAKEASYNKGRKYVCSHCGFILDRDENAARNLARKAQLAVQSKGIPNTYLACVQQERLSTEVERNACRENVSPSVRENSSLIKRPSSMKHAGSTVSSDLIEEPTQSRKKLATL